MLPNQRTNRACHTSPFAMFRNELAQAFEGQDDDRPLTGNYPVDIREDADNLYVDAELPGFKAADVQVTLEKGVLAIIAQRDQNKPQPDEKTQRHLHERRFTRVARSFTVPDSVDTENVNAKLADGVLHLTLQKRAEVKPRNIEIK